MIGPSTSRNLRRLLAGLLGVVCAVLVASSAAQASPAVADPGSPYLALSRDGVHWSTSLARPLFAPGIRWVPGDVRTERFFVRNDAADTGQLTIALSPGRRDTLLDTHDLDVAARVGTGPWRSVADSRHVTLAVSDVRAGEQVPVLIRATMRWAAPNGTMRLVSDLDFDVRMTQVDAVVVPPSHGSGGRGGLGGLLAATGDPVRVWMAWLCLGLLGTGSFLVVRRRQAPRGPTEDVTRG